MNNFITMIQYPQSKIIATFSCTMLCVKRPNKNDNGWSWLDSWNHAYHTTITSKFSTIRHATQSHCKILYLKNALSLYIGCFLSFSPTSNSFSVGTAVHQSSVYLILRARRSFQTHLHLLQNVSHMRDVALTHVQVLLQTYTISGQPVTQSFSEGAR